MADVYGALEAVSGRLEKTFILSNFLKSADELHKVVLLVQGRVFPAWDQRELGMSSKLVLKAISVATGAVSELIEAVWREKADLGSVAFELVGKKSQSTLFSQHLTVGKVFDNIQKIASLAGDGSVDRKVQLVAELLTSSSPREAKYIIRTVLGELRVGLGEGVLRDSIVWAFFSNNAGVSYDIAVNELLFEKSREDYEKYVSLVQSAIDVVNDFGEVALAAKKRGESGLRELSIAVGKPVKAMLFQKALGIADAFLTVGSPAAVEEKYDGFRLQIHKSDKKIVLFTRRLENVTAQFPDVANSVLLCVNSRECILDAEIVGVDAKTGRYLPFQDISQRIKRKYDISEMSSMFPVRVRVFDILFCDGINLINAPFIERRAVLKSIVNESKEFGLAHQLVTSDISAAERFYKQSLASGNEGIMVKNLQGIYKPGSRVGFGVKVKPVMDTLEVVIVGAEWGEGKRGSWLSSFIIAVRDSKTGNFVEIGRVGTGIKEKPEEGVSFGQLTDLLRPLIMQEKAREVYVRPELVIEVDYEEIQRSPTYSSNFALRFPRFVRLREDRSANDISSTDDVQSLFDSQRGRSQV